MCVSSIVAMTPFADPDPDMLSLLQNTWIQRETPGEMK
jgi:hypothetical protein